MVTDHYTDTLLAAFQKNGLAIKACDDFRSVKFDKHDWGIAAIAPDVIKLYFSGCKHIAFWSQGVWPEESYMRNMSRLRYFTTGMIERMAIKKSQVLFFVSDQMRLHYERKYHFNLKGKYYIMPCFNEEIHKKSFFVPKKYTRNRFAYVGSMAVWQCFEETIELYKKIDEANIGGTSLLILTKEKEAARAVIEKYGIKNYEIDFVPMNELEEKLRDVKYGFLLREDNTVNRVATPTKANTYLANGIIPIYSNSLKGLEETFLQTRYPVKYNNDRDIHIIEESMRTQINEQEIYNEYFRIFATTYCTEYHCKSISDFMK